MPASPAQPPPLANFRANRRGYWSLWIFRGPVRLSLFAELIANDRPLLVRYDGALYVPVLSTTRDRVRRPSRPRPTTATPTCAS
jgi:microcin C transport system permease protein